MRRLVIATRNPAKASEMSKILKESLGQAYETSSLADYSTFEEAEEAGETYEENAIIKAEAARNATGELCIADDAGLEIETLGGIPGVHSKRFAGVGTPFSEKIVRLLEELKDRTGPQRRAQFVCAVAIAGPHGNTKTFVAVREGLIAREPRGQHGFGYDSIFLLPEYGQTYAELDPEAKNRISHRGIVLALAANWLLSDSR